ncbi:uncharacterized protein AB675_4295 [Cyphellophora attinorum]|uniref:Glyoxalase-like domain-containing protein n=1 Tax=Cyphellophora attinorum TaxID=1664694 RepID=A0A0N0NKW2_9EURO|nr:uncharacterized protein AB675_4295 [Phialophora attinorum]KPI38611.1 hypothetical protein AB675_4295 [Phialophora attinorum]
MSDSYVCHDHIVLLLSNDELDNLPSFISSNFKTIEGGTHAGGSSRNRLIIFSDGTYIELFTWINKDRPMHNSWLDKPSGLIDFALTTLRPFNSSENHRHLDMRLREEAGDSKLGVKYTKPQAGGRKRKDGLDVKWEITRPEYSNAAETPGDAAYPTTRIDAPFFCHDVTARIVRVPFDDDTLTKHPCKATGIAAVDVLVPPEKLSAYAALYSSITGASPDQITDGGNKGVTFKLTTPTSQGAGPLIRVRVPSSDHDHDWLRTRGIGIRSIDISVDGRKGHGRKTLAADGIGSTIAIVW